MHPKYNRHRKHQDNHITDNIRKRGPDIKRLSTSTRTADKMIEIRKMGSANQEFCKSICDRLQDQKRHHHTDEFVDCEWGREDAVVEQKDGEFGHVEEEVVQNLDCEEVSESDDYFFGVVFVEVFLVIANHGALDVPYHHNIISTLQT